MTQTTLIFLILVHVLAILTDGATTVVKDTTKSTLTNSPTTFNRKYDGEKAYSPSSYPKNNGEGQVDPTAQQNALHPIVSGVISLLDDESAGALAFNGDVDTNVLLQKNIFFWGAQKTFQPAVVGSNGTMFAVNKESCGSKIEIPGIGVKREPKQDTQGVSAQTGTTSQNCVVSCPRDIKLAKTKTDNGTIILTSSLSWARFLKRGPILDCGGSGDTATITDGAIDDSNKTIQDENVWKRLLHDSNRKVLFPKMISTAEINTKLDQHDLDLFHGPSLGLVKELRKHEEEKLSMEKMAIETTTTKTVSKVTYHQQHCLEYDQRDMAQDLFIKWYVPFFLKIKHISLFTYSSSVSCSFLYFLSLKLLNNLQC